MAQYGEVRVDYLTYTTGVSPSEGNATTTISGLVNSPTFSGDVVVEGDLTVSGDIVASGVTISGITGLFASGIETAPSISFVDDTDTGFYNSATNEIRITTNGNDRLTIDDTGNVGIGTAAPTSLLHVDGGSLFVRDNVGNNITLSTYVNNVNDSTFIFQKARGGSSGPSAIQSTDDLGRIEWNGYDGSTYNLASSITSKATSASGDFDANLTYSSTQHIFRSQSSVYALIDSSGNVGIGTTNPSYKLQVDQGSTSGTFNLLRLQSYNGVNNKRFEVSIDNTEAAPVVQLKATRSGGSTPSLAFLSQTSESARIDSSGRLLVGVSSARTNFKFASTSITPISQLESTGGTTAFAIMRNSANNNASCIYLGKSRGSTVGSNNIVQQNDRLGSVSFNGADGTNLIQAARIDAEVDGTPDTDEMPGRLMFFTTANGASSPTSRMTIKSNGNVGIGTESPDDLLHLSANNSAIGADFTLGKNILRFEDTDNTQANGQLIGGFLFENNDSDPGAAGLQAAITANANSNAGGGQIRFYTAATSSPLSGSEDPRLIIDGSGNVGIGTSSPSQKLEIYQSNAGAFSTVRVANADGVGLNIAARSGANASIYATNSSDSLLLGTNSTERLRIDSSGNVGIGTSSPGALLELEKNGETELRLTRTNTVSNYCKISAAGSNSEQLTIETDPVGNGAGYINFRNNNSDAMRIDSSGNVGIGTTSPDGKLHVHTASAGTVTPWANADDLTVENSGATGISILAPDNNQANLILGSPSDNIGSIIRWVHDDGELQVGTHKSDGFLTFKTATGTERVRIDSSGRVGIGTSSPVNTLHLSKSSGDNAALVQSGSVVGRLLTNASGTYVGTTTDHNFTIQTNSTAKITVLNTGKVGIGTTSPNNLLSLVGSTPRLEITDTDTSARFLIDCQSTVGSVNLRVDQDNVVASSTFVVSIDGTERTRIDSSGRLLVGTSSAPSGPDGITPKIASASVGGSTAAADLQIAAYQAAGGSGRVKVSGKLFLGHSRSGVSGALGGVVLSGDNLGEVRFWGDDGTNAITAAEIVAQVDGTPGTNDMPGRIVLSTTANGASTPTERMRINNGGSTTVFSSLGNTFISRSSTSAGTTDNLFAGLHSATSTTNGTQSFVVRTNGNVQNTNDSYGAISDIKLKENIVDAESQWDDFKAVRFRKYNFKEETGHETFTQLGVIAQELELVSPGLVTETPDLDEDGNDLGTTTKSVKYSVLTKKALVALQEAMDRIEQLETSNADLLARVTALEGN